ncbi:hypothetical protein [Streptomyces sp. NPDC059781]|uniref:hypothetical protein n=1 Tax=Streptomyces sp. NPDC059781 TaxID=3346943 RepID=UPI00364A78DB
MKESRQPVEYTYVGPPELREGLSGATGTPVDGVCDLERFLADREPHEVGEPFTYVVDTTGRLLLAPRRSEHVACAGGRPVLAAGEIGFARGESGGRWTVEFVSNQSTGYCPGPESWEAVARSLDRAGMGHGAGYTHPIVFRCCPHCGNRNVVKEDFFVCSLCDGDLPVE